MQERSWLAIQKQGEKRRWSQTKSSCNRFLPNVPLTSQSLYNRRHPLDEEMEKLTSLRYDVEEDRGNVSGRRKRANMWSEATKDHCFGTMYVEEIISYDTVRLIEKKRLGKPQSHKYLMVKLATFRRVNSCGMRSSIVGTMESDIFSNSVNRSIAQHANAVLQVNEERVGSITRWI